MRIRYNPFILGNYTFTKNLRSSHVDGFLTTIGLLGLTVEFNDYYSISFNNGTKYSAVIVDQEVAFDNLEYLYGVFTACSLFGLNPKSIINDGPIPYDISVIEISMEYMNTISSEALEDYTDIITAENIKKTVNKGFGILDSSLYNPTNVHYVHRNKKIFSLTMSTSYLPPELVRYQRPNMQLLYNICTHPNHRNKGLSRAIIIATINDLLAKGTRNFLLEVEWDNFTAKRLYYSLGFKRIGYTDVSLDTLCHVMLLSFD